jgi:hypothetical protein
VDGPFFDAFIDQRKCLRKKTFGRFSVFVFNRRSQFFYLRAKDGFIPPVDRIPAQVVSPLALR